MNIPYCFDRSRKLAGTMLLVILSAIGLNAQDTTTSSEDGNINWQKGPCVAKLGELATLSLPEGYLFAGREGAIKFMEETHNPSSGSELGVVLRMVESGWWFVLFEFDASGYVKDDEKDRLDADAILASIRKGNDAANQIRLSKGWTKLEIEGWQRRPYYDSLTNNLTWSIRAKASTEKTINHSIRLLGRGGVMHADLVLGPELLTSAVPEFDQLLKGFAFTPGHRYSEYRRGDKLATYGLTALIAGGAGAVAAKSGLLAKLWKLIVVGVIALGAAIKRFFSAIISRGVEKPPELPRQD